MAAPAARTAVDADVAGGQRRHDGCTGWSDEDPHFGASRIKLKREGEREEEKGLTCRSWCTMGTRVQQRQMRVAGERGKEEGEGRH